VTDATSGVGSGSGSGSGSTVLVLQVSDAPTNPADCVCKELWTSPEDGGRCGEEQSGCTNCDDDDRGGWCLVSNPGCATDAIAGDYYDGDVSWSYCGSSTTSTTSTTSTRLGEEPTPSPTEYVAPTPSPTHTMPDDAVLCPDNAAADYCDCSGDCTETSFCGCSEAIACCADKCAGLKPWMCKQFKECSYDSAG
jgi:hypothetical protein